MNYTVRTLSILTDPAVHDVDKVTIQKLLSMDPVDALASLDLIAHAVKYEIRNRFPELRPHIQL